MSMDTLYDNPFQTTEERKASDFGEIIVLPMTEPLPALDALLKSGRKKRGLKQKDIADKIQVTPTIINRIEAGVTKRPSKKVLQKIAAYTGMGYSQLLYICGYSSVMEHGVFYRMDSDEIIDYMKIVRAIYRVNASLLEEMDGIDTISYENTLILKDLIKTMKSAAEIEKSKVDEKTRSGIWIKFFKSVMKILREQLTTLNDIFCSSAT